jgi:RNA polymerase sigma factor FliA
MQTKELDQIWKKYLKDRDNDSMQKLVAHYYIALVQKIASNLVRKFRYKVTRDELASHGVGGLYKALKAFDPLRGVKFETYAYPRVWGSIIDCIREEDWVPRSVRTRQTKIENAKKELESRRGHKIDVGEAVKHAGFDGQEFHVKQSKFHAMGFSSIETGTGEFASEDNKKDCNKYLVSKNSSSPDSKLIREEFLGKLIGRDFTPLERKIIYYYYYERLSMREIANTLGVSESRISQIHQGILDRLKTRIEVNPEYFGSDILELINSCNDADPLK